MKSFKKIVIFLFCAFLFKANSQTSIVFSYDANGNLIQRNVIIMFQKPGADFTNPFSKAEERQDSLLEFKVFPNPTKEVLFIEGELPVGIENAEVFLFNSMGQVLLTDNYRGVSKQITVRDLKSGLYYLEVKYSKKQSSNYKIIITN